MKEVIKTINARISTLTGEMRARSKEILSLERAKTVLTGVKGGSPPSDTPRKRKPRRKAPKRTWLASTPTPKRRSKATRKNRPPQKGLGNIILKALAEEGVTGSGLTATHLLHKMQDNGFKFTARNPYASLTGLLTNLHRTDKIVRGQNTKGTYIYKIRTTSELLDIPFH